MAKYKITTHPGQILLKDFLHPLGMTINALSMCLRVPSNRLLAICAGTRSVTPDTALRLARFYGNSPEFWMNLQMAYDLSKYKSEYGEQINKDVIVGECNEN
jgi:addiction module HigA family antidote